MLPSQSTLTNSSGEGTVNIVAAVSSEADYVNAILTVPTPNSVSLTPTLEETQFELSKSGTLGDYILYSGHASVNISLIAAASVEIEASIHRNVFKDHYNQLKFFPVKITN